MNSFDVIVCVALLVVMALGYRAGLLRSGLSIVGYIIAMPIAIWATSLIAPQAGVSVGQPLTQSSMIFFVAFLLCGVGFGALLRLALDDLIGDEVGVLDRLGGAVLGGVRVFLIAVTLVMIFDRLIPADAQPFYLVGSALRPKLSAVAATGLKSLPPDVLSQIDRLKRERRI